MARQKRNGLCDCNSGRKHKQCCRAVHKHEYPFRSGRVMIVELANGTALWAVRRGTIGRRGVAQNVGLAGLQARQAVRRIETDGRGAREPEVVAT